jgi:hypothetical protein
MYLPIYMYLCELCIYFCYILTDKQQKQKHCGAGFVTMKAENSGSKLGCLDGTL